MSGSGHQTVLFSRPAGVSTYRSGTDFTDVFAAGLVQPVRPWKYASLRNIRLFVRFILAELLSMDELSIKNDCIKKFKTLYPEECSVVCPQLMCFSLEKRGLAGLVANIISVQEEYAPLMPLDLEQTSEGGIHRLG